MKCLQRRDEGGQPGVQVEARVHTSGKRTVQLGVGGEYFGAPAAALLLMVLKTGLDFLGCIVSGPEP